MLSSDVETLKKVKDDTLLFKSTYKFLREKGRDYYLLHQHSPTRLVDDFNEWLAQRGRWNDFGYRRLNEHIASHIEYAEELKPIMSYWKRELGLNFEEIGLLVGRKWWYGSPRRNVFVRRFIYICQRLRPNG